MFDAGFHIHEYDIVPVEDQVIHQGLEDGAFRTDTAGPALLHGSHDQQFDIVPLPRKTLRDIINLGIESKKTAHGTRLSAGPLGYQLPQFGDGGNRLALVNSKSCSQVGYRVGIDGDNVVFLVDGKTPGQKRGHGSLAYSAFTADRNFQTHCILLDREEKSSRPRSLDDFAVTVDYGNGKPSLLGIFG